MLARGTKSWHETWNLLSTEPEGKRTQARKQINKQTNKTKQRQKRAAMFFGRKTTFA